MKINEYRELNALVTNLLSHLLGLSETHSQATSLVVSAVGARHQFTESSTSGKPRFQVELLRCRIVQLACTRKTLLNYTESFVLDLGLTYRTGNDVDDTVRKTERLTEAFSVGNELVEHLPRLVVVR